MPLIWRYEPLARETTSLINKKSLFRGYRHTSVEASMKERFHGEKCAGRGVESQDQVIRPSGMSGAAPDIPEGRILP